MDSQPPRTGTIFDACRPRPDVLDGSVTDADFAADLAQVLTGRASAAYADPARFFANTWPTRGLKALLANVCRRLTGAGGAVGPIFRLDTAYGGGKTHGLIALAHAAGGLRDVPVAAEFVDPALIPSTPVRIAAFDGENADPANGREPEVWMRMLRPEPLAVLTPWRKGRGHLPRQRDVRRLRSCTSNAYATAKPRLSRSSPAHSTVERTIRESGIELRRTSMQHGCVRLRRPLEAQGQWEIETFGSAYRLTD